MGHPTVNAGVGADVPVQGVNNKGGCGDERDLPPLVWGLPANVGSYDNSNASNVTQTRFAPELVCLRTAP